MKREKKEKQEAKNRVADFKKMNSKYQSQLVDNATEYKGQLNDNDETILTLKNEIN